MVPRILIAAREPALDVGPAAALSSAGWAGRPAGLFNVRVFRAQRCSNVNDSCDERYFNVQGALIG